MKGWKMDIIVAVVLSLLAGASTYLLHRKSKAKMAAAHKAALIKAYDESFMEGWAAASTDAVNVYEQFRKLYPDFFKKS